jgi:hypothetical protein
VTRAICLTFALLLCACGGDDTINRTNKNKAVEDARSSFGVIRTAMVAYFKKTGEIPEDATLSTFGIDPATLRQNWYTSYDLEIDGDKEDGYKGTKIIARPKEGTVAPEITMTIVNMKTGEHEIRE